MSGRVNNIENKFNELLKGNANQLGVRDADGNLRKFELKDLSSVIADLENVSKVGVVVPTNFNYKTNWFFESFLNPLLYVNIDTSTISTDPDINKFEVKRLIITSKITSDTNYFDATYKGKNQLSYDAVIKDLENRKIQYFEDTAELELPAAKNTVRGTFDVIGIVKTQQSEVIAGQTLTNAVVQYKLNTLQYKGITASSTIDKTLQVGDSLITADNTEYQITSIDTNNRTVILKLIFGTSGIGQGQAELRIKPTLERSSLVQLNLGYDERNVIFLKPISDRLAVTTDQYSQGFGIYTNDLSITYNNKVVSMPDFYQNFVSDFGLLFLSYAKEKKLPSTLGEIPNAPALASENFKVVQIDQHIQDADNTVGIKQKISAKEQVAAQIRELDKQITDTRANLNTNASLNEAQKLKLQKDLTSFADTRLTLTKSQQSLVSDITTSIKSTPSFITAPQYRVRGFWAMPDPKQSVHGNQNVAQFRISYRTLSKTGNAKAPDQFELADTAGNAMAATFSPWTEFLSKPREKKYNSLTGFYEWADENISDPDKVNSNQLDIPIKKGEIIEIRVKSLSEAGWPDLPVESSWSPSILVEFPADIETIEDATIVSQQAFAEEARLSFQDELNSKGLDIHLSTAFTTRDKYYAHKSEDIASGFFASDGNIIDLYTKLKNISDSLAAVQTAVSTGKGAIKVSIIDQLGNEKTLTNGESVELFAGYYKDLIKDTSVTPVQYSHGKIVATQYYVQIQNTSASALQLIATLNGGSGVQADASDPIANPSSNYHKNLRYDRSSLVINNAVDQLISAFTQREGYQSSQVQSQYVLTRYKDVKLANDLYAGDNLGTYPYSNAVSGNYNYGGYSVGSSTVPYVYGHYVPFNPLLTSLPYATTSNASVWNGTLNGSNVPQGYGRLSEFCIHTGHPTINPGGSYNVAWNNTTYNVARPSYSSGNTTQKYLPFSHGIHFETAVSEATNVFGANYYQQAAYQKAAAVTSTPSFPSSANMRENQYPIKCGFDKNDEWLIGKYTCGSYLFLAPASHATISVDGISPAGSYKYLDFGTDAAIKIPLIFQFRASDKLGYIGGWRAANPAGLKNIKYAKKVGLDIYYLGSVFSFDVTVSTQYEKETAVVTPVSAVQSTAASVITATA